MLVTKGELRKYRVPHLMHEYEMRGIAVHHYPVPDGLTPSIENVMAIIDLVRLAVEKKGKFLFSKCIIFSLSLILSTSLMQELISTLSHSCLFW